MQLRRPFRGSLLLREGDSDASTFNEVFLDEVYKTVINRVPRCPTVIDLGAHIGLASLFFATHYPESRLVSVEPDASNYRILVRNLEGLVRMARCRTLQMAAWSSERTLVEVPHNSPTRYDAFRIREPAAEGETSAEILGSTIQKIIELSGFENVSLLKVDIEGAETELFRGDPSWLTRVGAIAIEFHAESRKHSEFDTIMKEFKFRIYDDNPHTALAVRVNDAAPRKGAS